VHKKYRALGHKQLILHYITLIDTLRYRYNEQFRSVITTKQFEYCSLGKVGGKTDDEAIRFTIYH